MKKDGRLCDLDFSSYSQLIAAYIFGSKATGKDSSDSDIDIAIMVNEDFDFLQNYDLPLTISSDLEKISGQKVDVILFNKMDPLFQAEIRVKGQLIYVKDKSKLKKLLFKARKEYEDYLKLHKYYIRALKKRYAPHTTDLQNCVFLAKFFLLTGAVAPFGCGPGHSMVNQEIIERLFSLLTQYLNDLKEVQQFEAYIYEVLQWMNLKGDSEES